jgi:thymidylate synthase (FAD)
MQKVDVLDHGYVRLVESMGSDLSIVRAARVSYDAAWRAGEDDGSDAKLIRYLWRNQHTTPFEAVEFQFEVMAPIFVFRQWHRHRTASINELSARYRELPETFYLPEPENVGAQSASSKQARDLTGERRAERAVEIAELDKACRDAFAHYRKLLASGWPRELARMVLPLNTYSHMFWKANLRNLFHFLTLRCDAHAQHEIRVYADAMRELIRPIVPIAVSAWENGVKAAKAA